MSTSAGPGPAPRVLPAFGDPELTARLDRMSARDFDELDFGLIAMNRAGVVTAYNTFEQHRAGIAPERVLGRNFFLDVGPCTNNYLVAERYNEPGELDEEIDYVFTFRMRPTPVRLRMMARADSPHQYLAVRPR